MIARHGRNAGALNLRSSRREIVDEDGLCSAEVFASYASLALDGAGRVAQVSVGLASRDVIVQAKGILMERHGLSADEAFSKLVHSSQATNLKLHAVAQWLVDEQRGEAGDSRPGGE